MSKQVKQLNTGIKRLTKLAARLELVSKKHFNLDSWASHEQFEPTADECESEYSSTDMDKRASLEIKEGSCGTTACAFGHACMMPEFQKKCLRLEVTVSQGWTTTVDAVATYTDKNGDRRAGVWAGALFFKISESEAVHIFDPSEYSCGRSSKYYVIRRINSQIKKMQKELNALSESSVII